MILWREKALKVLSGLGNMSKNSAQGNLPFPLPVHIAGQSKFTHNSLMLPIFASCSC